MSAALRALLTGVIDYAGLFPPAKLPLEESIRNYARYRTLPESWMLGRFICPASRLIELNRFGDELLAQGPPFVFSALGRSGETKAEFVEGLHRDLADIKAFRKAHQTRNIFGLSAALPLADIKAFRKAHQGTPEVDTYEVKLPEELVHAASADAVHQLIDQCLTFSSERMPCFVEANPITHQGRGALLVIGRLQSPIEREGCRIGFKLRCGGTEAAAFPSSELLATLLSQRVTLKCTAGLHHPFRRWDAALGTRMHGFINVFVAGVLAEIHVIDAPTIQAILEDEEPRNFVFSDASLRWKDFEATPQQITEARRTRITSFGSCSFDEPREDLRQLGWL